MDYTEVPCKHRNVYKDKILYAYERKESRVQEISCKRCLSRMQFRMRGALFQSLMRFDVICMFCVRNMKNLCNIKCPKLPVVRKCCFCIPTYVGIAIFGYADLTLALVAFPILMYEMVDELTDDKPREDVVYSDPAVHLPVIAAAALVDIVLTVVLLIGAHRKNKLLLKIYFYFATISQLITLIADLPFFDYTEYRKNAIYLFFVVLNIYLLFLVHNVVYMREDSREIQYIAYEQHRISA